ncbi:hypothetical protein H9Q69_009676 [Fusarium xylarioides]|nr:hypothetical protein H9Q69_009676 [Fusarium xylarioides]
MVKKRNAPSGGFGAGSSSKMRKTANATKFYAVQKGREPGIYSNYDECQAQTTGFPGAKFKSFLTREDAQAYVAGHENPSADKPKFYAVAVGHVPGIYHTWDETQPQVTEVSGPKHKRFNTQEDAEDFIRQHASPETCRRLGLSLEKPQEYTGAAFEPVETSTRKVKAESAPRPKAAPKATPHAELNHETNGNILKIWTDGSSLANGQAGSCAGLGVYFGPNDERNLAERLPGEPQTNQRAELMAILRALEIAPSTQDVEIVSDSQYSIKCVTQWGLGWEQNGWRNAAGGEVKNQDLVRGVLARIRERDAARSKTSFQWVKGHASDIGNHRADGLANEGARKPTVS